MYLFLSMKKRTNWAQTLFIISPNIEKGSLHFLWFEISVTIIQDTLLAVQLAVLVHSYLNINIYWWCLKSLKNTIAITVLPLKSAFYRVSNLKMGFLWSHLFSNRPTKLCPILILKFCFCNENLIYSSNKIRKMQNETKWVQSQFLIYLEVIPLGFF